MSAFAKFQDTTPLLAISYQFQLTLTLVETCVRTSLTADGSGLSLCLSPNVSDLGLMLTKHATVPLNISDSMANQALGAALATAGARNSGRRRKGRMGHPVW